MQKAELYELLETLISLPKENEWLEFKINNTNPEEIGKRISALSNGANLMNKKYGYLVFGILDELHNVVGTKFKPSQAKKGNEELEHWLIQSLSPKIDFKFYEFLYEEKPVVIVEIPATNKEPVRFRHKSYIRIGSLTKELQNFPEKEAKIWNKRTEKTFEKEIVMKNIQEDDIIHLLDTQSYFELLNLPYPSARAGVITKLLSEKFIKKASKSYSITALGAILFAKDINDFEAISRKAVRVIVYDGKNKISTIREQIGKKGYAIEFKGLVNWINSQLPANEEIGKVFRKNVRMYPEIAIRELVANAIIHQDFNQRGTSPMVEIFEDRIEISNSGLPLITPDRFIDEFQSRNEILAAFMRRIGICEEKGSGIDKVIFETELYQLPAPDFQVKEKHTKVFLYSFKPLIKMDKKDKIRACYQHACLKYVSNDKMTNQSLRDRFKVDEKNAAIISRIIKGAIEVGLIKKDDPNSKSRKHVKYLPFWG